MHRHDVMQAMPLVWYVSGSHCFCFNILSRESKRSLLEEGSIMASLNHERVVKLLGVIMEDRDCSLVMELIPRGNLLVMLETVSGFNICSRTEKGEIQNS